MQTKLEWIRSQLLVGESANIATTRLNTPITTPNLTAQKQVPVPIDLVNLRSHITDLEAFKVLSSPIWDRITEAIKKSDTVVILSHMKALLAGGLISPETVAIATPIILLTEPDPYYQATIYQSPAQTAGYDIVLVSEVVAASLLVG